MARAFVLWLGSLAAIATAANAAETGPDRRAKAAFDRTKLTGQTYALYSWSWVKGAGFEAGPHWSAEFHRGRLHRVETPHVRVVADCEAGTGTLYEVDSGKTESGAQVARAACGINSNFPLRKLEWLGRVKTRFGRMDRIRILDPVDERIYLVDESGILVAAEIFPRGKSGTGCVQQEPLAVEKRLPAEDIFSARSLTESFAADRFRSPPASYAGDLWLGSRRCI